MSNTPVNLESFQIETSDDMMRFLVNNCVSVDSDATREHEIAIGKINEHGVDNSKWMSEWDIRYNGIVYYGFQYNFTHVRIERGNLWTAIAAYNKESRELFLVFKMKNLDNIMKNPFQYHYLPIFNSGNKFSSSQQQSFNFATEIENETIDNYNDLYEELIFKLNITPKKVIACGFSNNKFEARVYSNQQEEIYRKDFTYLIDPQLNDLGSAVVNPDPPTIPTPNESKLKLRKKKKRIIGLKKSN